MTAFGAGGGASEPHVRAGPGTVYIHDKVLLGGASGHALLVGGDLSDSGQEQTRTQVTGAGGADFDYDTVNVTGGAWGRGGLILNGCIVHTVGVCDWLAEASLIELAKRAAAT